jgi:hypothetical protein
LSGKFVKKNQDGKIMGVATALSSGAGQTGDKKDSGMALALLFGGTAMSIGGQIGQGRAAVAQGKAEQKIANYNADVLDSEAKAREYKTRFDQLRHRAYANRVIGSLRANQGMSGAVMDVGTPFDVVAEQMSELDLENAMIGYEGVNEASKLRSQATITRIQGKYARKVGENAQTASYINAGSSLLSSFGTAYALGLFDKKGGGSGGEGGGSYSPRLGNAGTGRMGVGMLPRF